MLSFRHAGLAETAPLCRTLADNHRAAAQAASGTRARRRNAAGLARKMLYDKRLTMAGYAWGRVLSVSHLSKDHQ
jgi:hypothetical protein